MTTEAAYSELERRCREIHLLGSTAGLLAWDQETMMPPGGAEQRSGQLALLARLTHEQFTSPRIGELLARCESEAKLTADPLSPPAVNLREWRYAYDRATKLPPALVEEFARVTSKAKEAWKAARKAKDFGTFRPSLEQTIALNRRRAECWGWADGGEPWDALADGYEPGMTAASVLAVFGPLRERLVALIGRIAEARRRPSDRFRRLHLPAAQQRAFVQFVSESIGFDYRRGRLDESAHPFCSGSHPGDIRMTTRFHEDNVNDALGSTMHESGHGIYNQGLPVEHNGTPRGRSVSLAIHESQSRTWENQVGRSREFWRWCHPHLANFFGDAVAGFGEQEVYESANMVEPSLIRVEADEATYNLHIMIRFELERAIVRGDLAAADLPGEWNARYRDYLGVEVPDDAVGCMQDIHWSMGAMGYFPTYTLGNLYAAQFFEAAAAAIGDLPARIAAGDFAALKKWLNANIHAHGQRYRSADLCRVVTGKPLDAEPLMRHLEGKFGPLYGL
ncbi:MAG: Thermostable carboxypeptidase 1 [Phycisphaerae bacterium]|nr:Thermostable carboxypeptidase 1 [Phycisphaerae bacterium]